MRIVVAPDKFRGTASAAQAADAMQLGLIALGHDVAVVPLSDGGEGFLEVLGGANRNTTVTGPLGDDVDAAWRMSSRTAVIEMARASGLGILESVDANDPVSASSYGTGELISAAIDAGARTILVGVGGSASTDGGLGALRAIEPLYRMREVELQVGCDVTIDFLDAARIFGPQKGATPAQVKLLGGRLVRLAQMYNDDYGIDVSSSRGSGAGGGLAGGLMCAGARLESGFELVAESLGLDESIADADLVVTGEGFLDEESFSGKVVGGVAELCASLGVPVVAVVGEALDGSEQRISTLSLVEHFGRERAFAETEECLRELAPMIIAKAVDGGSGPGLPD